MLHSPSNPYSQYKTVNDILTIQKQNKPNKIAYRFLLNDDKEVTLNYGELYEQVRSLSYQIQLQTKPFDRVCLSAKPGLDFIVGFYACLLARTIAVPIIPPANVMMTTRFLHVLKDADSQLILFDKETARALNIGQKVDSIVPNKLKHFIGMNEVYSKLFATLKNQHIKTLIIDYNKKPCIDYDFPKCSPEDIAFLQYTSGSTGNPKGVMITHANLLHNMALIRKVVNHSEDSHLFSWLPPYHDMGLIAGIMEPLYSGITATLMSTLDFIERPSRWVKGMAKYQCTSTGAPNFAYELCALKTTDELANQIDLSALEVAANGAEPLNSTAIELFYNKFAPSGFRKGAILPCYGLAESTVMVSGKPFLTDEQIISVDYEQLKKNRIVLNEQQNASRLLVSSGVPGLNVKIVHPEELTECKQNEIGEIWVHGHSVAKGYYNKEAETEKTFHAQIKNDKSEKKYLRTGDLGFIYGGELFVCGRIKNMIIIRGQNYYPQDIEFAVSSADPAIRKGCVVAYATTHANQEALAVVAEIKITATKKNMPAIIDRIKSEISLAFQLNVQLIILVAPKTIPKTLSGKLQRIKCQELIENQFIKPLYHYNAPEIENVETTKTSATDAKPAWLYQFDTANIKERQDMVKNLVLSITAKILSIPDQCSIDINKGFFDLGMDSIKAVEIKAQIQEQLNGRLVLDNSLIFNFPNIKAVIEHLVKELTPSITKENKIIPDSAHSTPTEVEDIAIIGMNCNFPGAASIDDFWQLLIEGREGITEVPDNRWNKEDYYSSNKAEPGKMITKRSGFIDQIEYFDPFLFAISPKEIEYLDPQQRMLLMTTWGAFEHANLNPSGFRGSDTGVFIGISSHDYETLIVKNISELQITPYWSTGNAASTATGRLSYYFGFEGPNMAVDTACSSSLVALHEACQSLQKNECRLAVVGGVNAILSPDLSIVFSKAGMLAPDGKCKTFDKNADGYVRGEGCGIVLLKKISEARKDNDTILAVIKASGLNQDGASSGLTVPNGQAQEKLLRKVLNQAKLKPSDIDYVECHGTGTSLGDPIEVKVIGSVYGQERTTDHPLNLGSVKTNIGHLEAASGIAGLIKTVLSLKHHILPKHLNFTTLNPAITIDFPAEIVTQTKDWLDPARPRRAAVSSFGFSGTNAHIILEEASVQTLKDGSTIIPDKQCFVLAAKTKKSLEKAVQSYINYLEQKQDRLPDICYSAAIGRSHLNCRLALISTNKNDLLHQLKTKAFKISENPLIDELIQSNDLSTLNNEYLAGKCIDWDYYYKPYINALNKVTLPIYQFDTQPCWLDIKKIKKSPSLYGKVVHKLLGAKQYGHSKDIRFLNQLDLNDLDYLNDHCVYGHILFPGAGFLESALAAGIEATNNPLICIKECSLLMPLALKQLTDYEVSLEPQTNDSYRGMIYAKPAGALNWQHYADFALEPLLNPTREFIDLAMLKNALTKINVTTLYAQFNQIGLTYGKKFQSIQEAYTGVNKALVAIKNEFLEADRYCMHPSLLDGVFQSVALAIGSQAKTIYIPARIERMNYYQNAQGLIWAEIKIEHYDPHTLNADINITDDSGVVLAKIQGFVARAITKHDLVELLSEKEQLSRYVEDYEVYHLPQSAEEHHDVLVINGNNNEALNQKHVIFIYKGHFNDLVATAQQVIKEKPLSFTLITQHAFGITQEDKINPEHTQALGFWRSFRLEAIDIPCYLIDIENQNYDLRIISLAAKQGLPEHQIILRDQVYVPRLISQETYAKRHHRLLAPEPQMYLTSNGSIDTLAWTSHSLAPLSEDEVKVRIIATALNFRDVLKGMNLYPGDSGDFGYECVGEVLAVGNKIQKLKPGNKVVVIGQGLFAGEAVVKEVQTTLLPEQLTPVQGASIPIVFLTAHYALNTLAKITKGQNILIHAASGGVGLAAIALAKLKGATIYASASQAKQNYLKEHLGLEHVYDSRSTDFEQQILSDTDGVGVDLVLNSLVGNGFIDASLGCLAKGGIFLEISKINIYSNEQMNQIRPDVTYHIIEIDKRIKEEPKAIQEELEHILSLFSLEQLKPLPLTEYPISELIDAFHYMQEARQIGKVVLSYPPAFSYDSNANYLISGGTGGLGMELAKHLIEKGVKHLTLLSRSQASPAIQTWITEQEAQGIHINQYSVDVANQQELQPVFSAMDSNYPLKGIFHAAGSIKDGLIVNLTDKDFETVLSPKIKGCLNLHEMSLKADLDCFVLFSSITSLIGNQGQSNYSAANAFMDGFAIQRKQQGLPALSINWGPFATVGMAASLESLHRSQGIIALETQKAFETMDSLLVSGVAEVGIMTVDWSKALVQDSYLTYLVPQTQKAKGEWMLILEATQPEQRGQVIVAQIKKVLAEILNISDSNAIDNNKEFFDMGMDSLMLIELKNKIEFKFSKQITLTSADVFEKNSVIKLAECIFSKIDKEQSIFSITKEIETPALKVLNTQSVPKETIEHSTEIHCFEEFIQLEHDLEALEKAGIDNLFFNTIENVSSDTVVIHGKKYINFSGYNYLGLSGHDEVNQAVYKAIKKYGTSVSASRLVSGQKPIHDELESAIARLIGTEKSLLFSSGYGTNVGAITTLVGKEDAIFHDELSHNSLIQASIYSGAQRFSYPHNDIIALNELLLKHRKNYRRALIITEGVFSMDGDIAPIPELIKLKKSYHTLLMVDEAHSMGVLGKTGRGIREHFQLDPEDVDVWMGTLSKSFASCGGYIAGSASLVKLLQYRSQGFIFSAGIPPSNAAASLKAIELMVNNPQKVTALHTNAQSLLNQLKEYKVDTGMSDGTPIIPVIVGSSNKALILSNKLRDAHIYAMPIIYPAVAEQAARVRLFVNCLHQEEQINMTAETIAGEYFKLR